MIRDAFGGKLEKHWREVMQEVGIVTENNVKGAVSDLVKNCLNDDDCHEEQVYYIKEICKPKEWRFREWLQRFETINKYLEYMNKDLHKQTEHQIGNDAI